MFEILLQYVQGVRLKVNHISARPLQLKFMLIAKLSCILLYFVLDARKIAKLWTVYNPAAKSRLFLIKQEKAVNT